MEESGPCFNSVGSRHASHPLAMDTLLVCIGLLCSAPQQQPQKPPDKWIAEDKLKHFAFSYLITSGSAGAARTVTGRDESVLIGAGVGLLAGIAKELYDKKS